MLTDNVGQRRRHVVGAGGLAGQLWLALYGQSGSLSQRGPLRPQHERSAVYTQYASVRRRWSSQCWRQRVFEVFFSSLCLFPALLSQLATRRSSHCRFNLSFDLRMQTLCKIGRFISHSELIWCPRLLRHGLIKQFFQGIEFTPFF